uniref:Uncharacterized protein n=1 Tax=Sinocyclocheilus rhinocerous TaxID=307959 RepID=A0A673I2F0_9TELE
MKKIFNFKKKKGSPSPSETGSVLSASYDVKEKDLGKVHKAAFSGDVVKLRQLAKKNDLNQLDKENRCRHQASPSGLSNGNLASSCIAFSLPCLHFYFPNCKRMTYIYFLANTFLYLLGHPFIGSSIQPYQSSSALMIAACNGQISMVRLLLQYDADITVKDDKGWSSDDYAVMNGHHACSHLIIEHGTKRRSLQSPSHFTASKKKQTSVLGSPGGIGADLALGGPALDKDGESNCVLLDLHNSRFSVSSVYVRQYCCSVDCSVLIWFCFPIVTPHSSVVAAGSSSAGARKGIASVCQSMCCRSDTLFFTISEIKGIVHPKMKIC